MPTCSAVQERNYVSPFVGPQNNTVSFKLTDKQFLKAFVTPKAVYVALTVLTNILYLVSAGVIQKHKRHMHEPRNYASLLS